MDFPQQVLNRVDDKTHIEEDVYTQTHTDRDAARAWTHFVDTDAVEHKNSSHAHGKGFTWNSVDLFEHVLVPVLGLFCVL